MAGPDVSVVVGDYAHRGYLESALRSVDAQSLPRERIELIVTKSYPDPELERRLSERGAKVLLDREPILGGFFHRAVEQATAPIVAFLDDDDEFEPEHLAAALEAFRRHPGLGLYRNRVSVIDGEGRAVPPARWRSVEVDATFDARGPMYLEPERAGGLAELLLRRTSVTFNASTMAVRRDLLAGELGAVFDRVNLPDLFLVLATVFSNRALYLDDRRLTRFRYYARTFTRGVGFLGKAEAAYADLGRLATARGWPDFAELLLADSVHYGRLFRGSGLVERVAHRAGRREVAQRTADYLRYLGAHPEERGLGLDTWAAAVYGGAYLGWPLAAARVARARLVARGLF